MSELARRAPDEHARRVRGDLVARVGARGWQGVAWGGECHDTRWRGGAGLAPRGNGGHSRLYGSGCACSFSFCSPARTSLSMFIWPCTLLLASNWARSSFPFSIQRSRCTVQFISSLRPWRYSFFTRMTCATLCPPRDAMAPQQQRQRRGRPCHVAAEGIRIPCRRRPGLRPRPPRTTTCTGMRHADTPQPRRAMPRVILFRASASSASSRTKHAP